MKRSGWIGVWLAAFLLLPGCIDEGLDECPPGFNAVLAFTYTGDTGEPELFGRMIDRVSLYVYDAAEELVSTQVIDKEALAARPGADLALDPGSYRIVCWGNLFEASECTGAERLSEGRVNHPNFARSEKIPTADHLYYGACDLTVPASGTVSGEVPFVGAHINLKVYIGIGDAAIRPTVEAHDLMPQYDMEMNPGRPFATTYYPETGYDTERNLHTAFFQTYRFADDNPVRLEVKKPSGETFAVIGLKEYMAANRITVDGKQEATVPVLIEVTDLGVVISVPEWESMHVDPET